MNFLKKNSINKSLYAISGDLTNVNTGWKGEVMHWVEEKINHKLIWLICAFHTNLMKKRCLTTNGVVKLAICLILQYCNSTSNQSEYQLSEYPLQNI